MELKAGGTLTLQISKPENRLKKQGMLISYKSFTSAEALHKFVNLWLLVNFPKKSYNAADIIAAGKVGDWLIKVNTVS